MAVERRVLMMRIAEDQLPGPGGAMQLSLPDTVNELLDTEGWRVVSHHIATADLTGTLVLSLYVER